MATRSLALSLLAVACVATPLLAQDDSSLFFDTVDVYVVNVEVVVTDKDGNPATGLTRDDFEIYEDGQRVEIGNFFAVEGRQAVMDGPALAAGPDPSAPDLAPAPATKRLNLVVFVDNFNMRPENRNLIFDNLRKYLKERLDSRDRVMLVSLNDSVEIAENFTNDTDRLIGTLDRLEKQVGTHVRFDAQHRTLLRHLQVAKLAVPSAFDPGDFDSAVLNANQLATEVRNLVEVRYKKVRSTLDVLKQFTDSLAGMPGRKAILYVSDGLPTRPADSLAQAWVNKFEGWIFDQNIGDLRPDLRDLTMLGGSARYDATRQFNELVAHASANLVTFYPISNGSRTSSSRVSAEFGAAGTANGTGPMSQDIMALENQSLDSSLLMMAEGTGGVAFTRTTNIDGLLERMVHDFDSFYSLGYSPPHGADDEFHKVEVKVKRPDLVVRHLKGYREKDPMANLKDLTLSALQYDLEDNRLEIRLDPGEQVPAKGGRFRVPVMVKIPFKNLLLLPQEEVHSAKVSLFVVVRDDKKGGVSSPQRVDLPIEIPNGKVLEALSQVATYPLELDMKQGPKRISIGVRDHLANVDSTVNLELEVGASQGDVPKTGASP